MGKMVDFSFSKTFFFVVCMCVLVWMLSASFLAFSIHLNTKVALEIFDIDFAFVCLALENNFSHPFPSPSSVKGFDRILCLKFAFNYLFQ